MNKLFKLTFGGMTKAEYIRHLAFGSLFLIMPFYILVSGEQNIKFGQIIFFVFNTLLYPYSRFVYESIVNFIMGKNVFFVNALLMMFMKLFTMLICWSAAIFIAPIGLAYLYYLNTKEYAKED